MLPKTSLQTGTWHVSCTVRKLVPAHAKMHACTHACTHVYKQVPAGPVSSLHANLLPEGVKFLEIKYSRVWELSAKVFQRRFSTSLPPLLSASSQPHLPPLHLLPLLLSLLLPPMPPLPPPPPPPLASSTHANLIVVQGAPQGIAQDRLAQGRQRRR